MRDERINAGDIKENPQSVRQIAEERFREELGFIPLNLVKNCHYIIDQAAAEGKLEETIKEIFANPANFFSIPPEKAENVYSYILPEIFGQPVDLSLSPEINTALVRYCLKYGVKSPYWEKTPELKEWFSKKIFDELFLPEEETLLRKNPLLYALIDSLLNPQRTDFNGLSAPSLDSILEEKNKEALIFFLETLKSRYQKKPYPEGIKLEEFFGLYAPKEEVIDFLNGVIKVLKDKDLAGEKREVFFKYLKIFFMYSKNIWLMSYLSGFEREWKRQAYANLLKIGKIINEFVSLRQEREVPLAELLNDINLEEAEKRYPGIKKSFAGIAAGGVSQEKIKIREAKEEEKSFYLITVFSSSGRCKRIVVSSEDKILVAAAVEQALFFLAEGNFGPEECWQFVFGRNKEENQALGQALGNFMFFTTEGALQYGGTQAARKEHEIHERLHLEAFDRWQKIIITYSKRDPGIIEGALYAYRDRVDPQILFFILENEPEEIARVFLNPWSPEIGKYKYSLYFLAWAFIKEELEECGYSIPTLLDKANIVFPDITPNYPRDKFIYHPFWYLLADRNREVKGTDTQDMEKERYLFSSYNFIFYYALVKAPEFLLKKDKRIRELFGEKGEEMVRRIREIRDNPDDYYRKIAKALIIANIEALSR